VLLHIRPQEPREEASSKLSDPFASSLHADSWPWLLPAEPMEGSARDGSTLAPETAADAPAARLQCSSLPFGECPRALAAEPVFLS